MTPDGGLLSVPETDRSFVDDDGVSGSGSIDLEKRYLYSNAVDQVLAQENTAESTGAANRVIWHLTDHLGTVRDLVTNDGELSEHFEYDAFGEIHSGDTSVTRYLFTSREFDADVEMQYSRARWYDAGIGRWASEDPLGFIAGDTNVVRYVGNGPPSHTDASGLKKKGGGRPTGPTRVPAKPKHPPLIKAEDLIVIIYIDQPTPGQRDDYRNGYDYGHAMIQIVGTKNDGSVGVLTGGFYPTDPFGCLDRKPQPGLIQTGKEIGHAFDVSKTFYIPSPDKTFEELKSYIDEYDNNKKYDLDDSSCGHFVIRGFYRYQRPIKAKDLQAADLRQLARSRGSVFSIRCRSE